MRFAAFIFLLFSAAAHAATVYVASYGDGTPSQANVQSACTAASAGDTIVFPVGNATWSSAVSITKALTIVGAGAVTSGGTKITSSGAMTSGSFLVSGLTTTSLVRITGIYFDAVDWTPQWILKLVANNSITKLRVDHCVFNQANVAIEMNGCKGVIDHNYFYNTNTSIYYSAGTDAQATASWVTMTAGSSDALFIEDNHFIKDSNFGHVTGANSCIEAYNGGKFVVRYNTFDGATYPVAETFYTIGWHGSAPAGLPANQAYWQQELGARRSPAIIEIYDNTMTAKRIDYLLASRGGSALIHGNTVTSTDGWTAYILLREEEYTNAEWSPLRTAWPAEDQVHNSFIWSNTNNGAAMTSANIIRDPDDAAPNEKIKQDRDYFLHAPQSSGGKETFTGQNGGTNTYPTNGSTYPTLGNMTFSSSGANAYYPYTPYTYPHPLVSAYVDFSGAGTTSFSGSGSTTFAQ